MPIIVEPKRDQVGVGAAEICVDNDESEIETSRVGANRVSKILLARFCSTARPSPDCESYSKCDTQK